VYRALELRGEIRGGRFVAGFVGEQFALPAAVDALRALRQAPTADAPAPSLAPRDPVTLVDAVATRHPSTPAGTGTAPVTSE
jgi:ATP-dependent Lhr-like helicase